MPRSRIGSSIFSASPHRTDKAKTAFATGGNIGVGRALSLTPARYGTDVAGALDLHQSEAQETVKHIEDISQKGYDFQLDARGGKKVD